MAEVGEDESEEIVTEDVAEVEGGETDADEDG